MDDARFDALARSLVTTRSRRSLTRLLGGLSLGGVLSVLNGTETAAALLNGGARCTKGNECKSGRCLKPSPCDCRTKNCRCSCACSTTDPKIRCIAPSNPCKKTVCTATGQCVMRNKCPKQAEQTCGRTGECTNGTCLRYGTTTECGTASCNNNQTAVVRQLCDGNGTCVPQEEPCVREEPCGQTGFCDFDTGACTTFAAGESCGSSICLDENTEQTPLCDGAGDCVPTAQDCNTGHLCLGGACKRSCTEDEHCASDRYCAAKGLCASQEANGAACGRPRQCASGFCTNGVCCESACDDLIDCTTDTCEAGTGVCTHTVNHDLCPPETPTCDPQAGCI